MFAVAIILLIFTVRSTPFQTSTTGLLGKRAHPSPDSAFTSVPIPPRGKSTLGAATRAAGCQLRSYPDFGRGHTVKPVRYKTNPPTSGDHSPVAADDGAFAPDNVPPVTQTVHALEHGRVEIQWRTGLSQRQIGQLKSLFDERDGYHTLLFENRTRMPYAVAATAWTHLLGCPRFSPVVFDALRAFRARYTDKGPESVP